LLLGDGHGHFNPVPPATSQLIVPGDAKALTVLDLDHDGWPDFLISRNNSSSLAYRNLGRPGRHSLRIALHGPPGNPSAVGARLSLEFSDGSTQTTEIYAGSGYYSQSSPASFFGYPDSLSPSKLRVRWPSGLSSEHSLPPNASSLSIAPPP
jgi:hypothetical protein